MFPHTITLFNVYKKEDKIYYHRTPINGVFFYKSNQVTEEGKGIANASQYHCIIPLEELEKYVERKVFNNSVDKSNIFTFAPNDIVVFGKFNDINNVSDLQKSTSDYFSIKIVNDNRYGNEGLQSIEVTD